MRIIAGIHRSRKLETLPGLSTRPMMDQKKEAVFHILGPYFNGGVVLDLFGGSGALSLEAISRGADLSYVVDVNMDAIKVIKKNVENLRESEKVRIFNLDYQSALSQFRDKKLKFNLVFLDPPYKLNVIDDIIDFLFTNHMISKDTYIICQYLKENYGSRETDKLEIVKRYSYKESELTIYLVK